MAQIKLVNSIVDSTHSLVGFIISGKEKDLGGLGDNQVERCVSIDELLQSKFSNNQISVVNNRIVEKGKFKINQLPMKLFTDTGYFDLDNTINLVGRFVQNNENIGFAVQFANGATDNIKYDNLLMVCKWFNPGNFAIRTSSKGNSYICAKQGCGSIDELPATVLGKESKAKRTKSAAKEKKSSVNGVIESGFDILDIYDFIDSCKGNVIKLPNEEYKAISESVTTDGDFSELGIGEVASPRPIFSSSKLNVNAGFKKVGNVKVNIYGTEVSIPTFTFRTKSLFFNGENHMKKIGIAVPKENEAQLVKTLGASLALQKIEEHSFTTPISQILGNNNLAFYIVDTSKIDLISQKKRDTSIKSNPELISICKKLYELKVISKAMGPKGGIMKDIKDTFGTGFIADATGKKIFPSFSMYSKEGLEMLQSIGVDIYSGSYTNPNASYSSNPSRANDSVEIEYILKGADASKLTGAKIIEKITSGEHDDLPASAVEYIIEVLNISDYQERYAIAKQVYDETEIEIAKLNKVLWMHNASMYLNGNKSRVHTHDTENWVIDTKSRVKKGTVYFCREKGCEGLAVKVTNVSI